MVTKEKRFSFHWGSGVVAEEAQVEGPYDLPTIQLLAYTEGNAAGATDPGSSRVSPGGVTRNA